MANAPKFDPNRPYETVSRKIGKGKIPKSGPVEITPPKFDPNAGYDPVSDRNQLPDVRTDLSRFALAGDVLGAPVRGAVKAGIEGENILEGASTSGKALLQEFAGLPQEGKVVTGEDILTSAGVEGEGIGKTIGGVGVEMITDPSSYIGGGIGKLLSKQAYKGAIKKAGRAFSKFVKPSDIAKGIDADLIGRQMFLDDMSKHSGNPAKLYKLLTGKSRFKKIAESSLNVVGKEKASKGLIGELSDQVSDLVIKADTELMDRVNPLQIMERSVKEALPEVTEKAGLNVDASQIAESLPDMIKNVLKRRAGIDITQPLTRMELLTAKRKLGKTIQSKEFFKGADDAQALDKAVSVGAERALKNILEESVKGLDLPDGNASEVLKALNKRSQYYMQARDVLKGIPLKDLQSKEVADYVMQGIAGMGVGAGASLAMGGRFMPEATAIGGILSTAKSAGEAASRQGPAIMSRAYKELGDKGPLAGAMLPQMSRQIGREPQSVENDPFVSATYPRSTQDVSEHRESFLAKVQAMEPEHYEQLKHITNMPEQQMAKVLPAIAKKFPHLFEYDEYHRFDGIVPQEMRPEAIKKVWAMPMSNTEKTGLIDKLNRTGELDI